MDQKDRQILLNGEDKTDSIQSCRPERGGYTVVFKGSTKEYHYGPGKVRVLLRKAECRTSPPPADRRKEQTARTPEQPKQGAESGMRVKELFEYFKETAAEVGLRVEDQNILSLQYDRVKGIDPQTVLAHYLDRQNTVEERQPPETLIYPFGLNQSQKKAVENAFTHQVSIIQGPPGTGKTQTILNIIANAVRSRQTVAVVSNNNSATLNVAEKLEKKDLAFLTAFLGSRENKQHFLAAQTGKYPDMSSWKLEPEELEKLSAEVKGLSEELNRMLDMKNRIAEIDQELLQLKPEQHYFNEYYDTYGSWPEDILGHLTSQKILALWAEYEDQIDRGGKLSFIKKLSIVFRYHFSALRIFTQAPERIIPYLQHQFYTTHQKELTGERANLERRLEGYAFHEKISQLTEQSMRLFRQELSERYRWDQRRPIFDMTDFRRRSEEFNREYPVVLSTTYSIRGTLGSEYIYDYLIIDEASQVDLATGVLALSCARNVVIVGDLKQLPNVLKTEEIKKADAIWDRHPFEEPYHFSTHSLLSSAVSVWYDKVPSVLLREHYRCHPKIIEFCNQKFYDGQLIIMTEDHNEKNALALYRTAEGNHARNHVNQRQIDVIREEVLPRLEQSGYQDIGVIAPYRDQVEAIRRQLGDRCEVDTVHKFQGREKEAIILTSVDNVITEFVNDARMMNVAVSRAVQSLVVITSQNPLNDRTNYGDLARYIAYQNCEIINSKVYSVFDLLYQSYAPQRREYLKKHRRISEYDSENLLYTVIEDILRAPAFSGLRCAVHVSLATLVKDYSPLSEEERIYAFNPLTHTDFLFYYRMDKAPVLALELDGTSFHQKGSRQAARDEKKNHIFEKCGIPLLRIRTDESGERRKIVEALQKAI